MTGISLLPSAIRSGYVLIMFLVGLSAAGHAQTQDADHPTTSKANGPRRYIGVVMEPFDRQMASTYALPAYRSGGVLVADVVPESPAAAAGLRKMDVIKAFDSHPVKEPADLAHAIGKSTVNMPHTVTLIRDGKVFALAVWVKPQPIGAGHASVIPDTPEAKAIARVMGQCSEAWRITNAEANKFTLAPPRVWHDGMARLVAIKISDCPADFQEAWGGYLVGCKELCDMRAYAGDPAVLIFAPFKGPLTGGASVVEDFNRVKHAEKQYSDAYLRLQLVVKRYGIE